MLSLTIVNQRTICNGKTRMNYVGKISEKIFRWSRFLLFKSGVHLRTRERVKQELNLDICCGKCGLLFSSYLIGTGLKSSKVTEVRWRCVQVLLGVWERKAGACAGSRATITQAACGLVLAAKTSHSARLRLSPRAIRSFLHPSTGCCPPLTPNHTQMVRIKDRHDWAMSSEAIPKSNSLLSLNTLRLDELKHCCYAVETQGSECFGTGPTAVSCHRWNTGSGELQTSKKKSKAKTNSSNEKACKNTTVRSWKHLPYLQRPRTYFSIMVLKSHGLASLTSGFLEED